MRTPVIVVTGGIASGKTTIARVMAARGGTIVDCDSLAHRAYDNIELKEMLVRTFGRSVLTPTSRISRVRLGRIVFSDDEMMDRLNRMVRPFIAGIINDEVGRLRGKALYIVLDAVLFFQYKFRFKVDLVIVTEASEKTRLRRLVTERGLTREEALMRLDRQKPLHRDWLKADFTIGTDGPSESVVSVAKKIRDDFLEKYRVA